MRCGDRAPGGRSLSRVNVTSRTDPPILGKGDSPMRLSSAFAAACVLAIQVAACSSSSGGTKGTGAGGGTGGTCDGACGHYLQCKGFDNPQNRAECSNICANKGYTEQQLSDFTQADCASAIAAIEGTGGTKTGGGGGTGTGADCADCQWDGQSCIWISPSTGLYQACGAGCCPGH